MGAVYRAFDEALQRNVAIKRLIPDTVDGTRALRFRREARLAARLNHPAIVHIYEIVESDQGDWIVMELVEGKTLDRMLREGMLNPFRTVRLAREIAEGLAEAHAQGIVHRDLKASNVMVTASGRVKILDFGLAKMLGGEGGQDLSETGVVLGTCHAMSPEQAQGHATDHRSDLFSLGSLLYELLSGSSPFYAANSTETLARICVHEPRPLGEVDRSLPLELTQLVHRLLSKSPADRPQSTQEVVSALASIERSATLDHTRHAPPVDLATANEQTRPAARSTTPPRSSGTPLTSSERRQMTVLCCELARAGAGGADDAQALDPESLYELMSQLRPLAERVAGRYEASVGTVVGQRLLLFFGYPVAHEDDARRAVRAALDLIVEAGEQPGRAMAPEQAVTLRVGIHTGPAVVSTNPQAPEPVLLGATLDVALRLLASAEPGSVVVSPATRSLVQRSFATDALPPLPPAPGSTDRLVPYRVSEGVDSGAESAVDHTPIVGRDRELSLLASRWEAARAGTGQAVLISGEPGIGKSRLLRALRERIAADSGGAAVRWLTVQGSPYTQNTPLYPVKALLQHELPSDPHATTLSRLESLLARHALVEALPLFASILDLPEDQRPAPPAMAPERQREETLEALVALIVEMSVREPVVLQVEDLHWLDATTLAWLERLIDHAATAPLLLVMTVRPHVMETPWEGQARAAQIALGPLSGDEIARLVTLLSGDTAIRPQVQQQIVERTDGVPLFVEELTRSAIELGDTDDWRDLPTTLRDSLTSRLARLGTAKEVAQLASVIGRAFTLRLLAAVSSQGSEVLERELRRLVQSGLVHRRGFGAQTRYAFKHALVRDAAYDSLLRRERQQIHLRIAAAMEEEKAVSPDAALSEEIAHHYMAGEQFERAFTRWREAGQAAIGRSAHVEAAAHFRHALRALEAQPASAARDQHEIGVRSRLALSVGIVRGLSSAEVEAIHERMLALMGHVTHVPPEIYFGLWNFYVQRGQLVKGRELARQRSEIADATGDTVSRLLGLYTSAATDQYLGRMLAARAGFEELLAMNPSGGSGGLSLTYDVGVVARALLGDTLWHLGLPATGQALADEAIVEGQRVSPFTHSITLVIRIILAMSARDAESRQQRIDELIALSEQHSFQYWAVHWNVWLALGRIGPESTPGEIDEALQDAAGAITMMRTAFASNLQCTRFLAWTIAASVGHGRFEMARALLADGMQIVEQDQERYWESDLRRLDAAVRRGKGAPPDEVERGLQEALAIARTQGARIFELRVAVDLAGLWRDRGRVADARALLEPLYASFTEGLDTPDLTAARRQLAALEPPQG
jgi:class 3 adenylate cyclase